MKGRNLPKSKLSGDLFLIFQKPASEIGFGSLLAHVPRKHNDSPSYTGEFLNALVFETMMAAEHCIKKYLAPSNHAVNIISADEWVEHCNRVLRNRRERGIDD